MGANDDNKEKPRGWTRIGELGPAWITAIAALIVALTGAGFFAGRATVSSTNSGAQSTTATGTQMVSTSEGSGPTQSTTTSTIASTSAGGAQLGSYSINLSDDYSVPLAATAPVPSQFSAGIGSGDIAYSTANNGIISQNFSDTLLNVPGGSSANYQTCSHDTVAETVVFSSVGTEFCLEETSLLVGATITAVHTNPDYVTIQVTVWRP